MLLIGQPKSGTSSFVASLADIMDITPHNSVNGDGLRQPEGFHELQKWHTTLGHRNRETLEFWIRDRRTIIKEHVVPDSYHLKLIEEIGAPVVVLLRQVEDGVDCYRRFAKKHAKPVDLAAIRYDLYRFKDLYEQMAEQNKNVLVIYYRDIVLNFHKTVKKVLKHYGASVPKNLAEYELATVFFTGVGLERLKNDK